MALRKFAADPAFEPATPRVGNDRFEPGIYRAMILNVAEAQGALNSECPFVRYEIYPEDGDRAIGTLVQVFRVTSASNAERDAKRKEERAESAKRAFQTLAHALGLDVSQGFDPADMAGKVCAVGIDRFERHDGGTFENIPENCYAAHPEALRAVWSPTWSDRKERSTSAGFGGAR